MCINRLIAPDPSGRRGQKGQKQSYRIFGLGFPSLLESSLCPASWLGLGAGLLKGPGPAWQLSEVLPPGQPGRLYSLRCWDL